MPIPITIVGGGVAGLVASIACAETGAAHVRLLEARPVLGGRATTSDWPWRANLGPHALYTSTGLWSWLDERGLVPPVVRPRVRGMRVRWQGRVRRVPPVALVQAGLRIHRLGEAPVDRSFRDWAMDVLPPESVAPLCASAGVLTFDHDPGRLSAAFVAERLRRIAFQPRTVARYVVGGWSTLVDGLAAAARERGVHIETGARVDTLPEDGPVVVATSLGIARRLLRDPRIEATGTRTVLLDVGVRARAGDPTIVADLDEAGWADRFSATDATLAPVGHQLVQCHIGARPGETLAEGVGRVERLLDAGFPGWRAREVWRRRSLIDGQTGAVDLPGATWRDRPAVDRGDGVAQCGDMVAAPGHLAEVSWASALAAAAVAVDAAAPGRSGIRFASPRRPRTPFAGDRPARVRSTGT